MQHTEKEWWIEGNGIINSKDGHIAYMNPYCEKAQRIVDCVNGCAGIENPGAVRELLNAVIGLDEISDELAQRYSYEEQDFVDWLNRVLALKTQALTLSLI
ncbi:hypothetical protein KA005_14465 [bacterium]|nr:hypothetical protein [bacterium]